MPEPNAYILSRCLTQLIGRKVSFTPASFALDGKNKQVYGIYDLLPVESAVIVKADLALLGSIAGALVGLPDAAVKDHLKSTPIEELLRDAIAEVLNIASAAVTLEGRAVFSKMVTDPTYIDGVAAKVYKEPFRRTYFGVAVEGYQGGRFGILSPFVPTKPPGSH